MNWRLSHRFDLDALPIADRHYNRQKPGTPQFVPPGRCVVLLSAGKDALWVSSSQQFVQHAWPGAWVCSCFRNESQILSSDLIREAVGITRYFWGPKLPEPHGFITFVDPLKVRHKRDPGRCYVKAGWKAVGHTQGGLVVLQLLSHEMPAPIQPPFTTDWLFHVEH